MRKLLKTLSSITIFIAITVLVVVLSALATVIPQDESPDFYLDQFGRIPGAVINATGFSRFFTSPLLLGLAIAAGINLAMCTIPRFLRRLRSLRRAEWRRSGFSGIIRLVPRFSADIIHLGVLLLIAAGVGSIVFAEHESFLVRTGQTVSFRSHTFEVTDSREIAGASGAFENVVLDWELEIDISPAETGRAREIVRVRLNRPQSYAGMRVHFSHWSNEDVVHVADGQGDIYEMLPGEGFQLADGGALLFQEITDGDAFVFARIDAAGNATDRSSLRLGQRLGEFVIAGRDKVVLNGFRVTFNPLRPVTAVGLAFVTLGMGLFVIRVVRRRDGE